MKNKCEIFHQDEPTAWFHKKVSVTTVMVGDVVPLVITQGYNFFVTTTEVIKSEIIDITPDIIKCKLLETPQTKSFGFNVGTILSVPTGFQVDLNDCIYEADEDDELYGTVVVTDYTIPESAAHGKLAVDPEFNTRSY